MKPSLSYCRKTIELVENIEGAFISLGERLHKIHTERLWEGQWGSYEEYLGEMRLSKSKASKIESIYSTYVLEYEVAPEKLSKVGWSSLYSMLPAVTSKKSAKEWVEKASTLRREELEDEVREIKLGSPCEHDEVEDLHLQVCLKCKKHFRVYE